VNAFKPWLSSADIDKGSRWSSEIAGKLETSKAGIICLTPSNLTAPWILFEAGALSKTLQHTYVCTLLDGLEPRDVTGPLAQFQATTATRASVLALLKTLNGALGESAMSEAHIEETFAVWWTKLASEIENLPPDGATKRPHRTEREMLEELVDTMRSTNAHNQEVFTAIVRVIKTLSEGVKLHDGVLSRYISAQGVFTYGGDLSSPPDPNGPPKLTNVPTLDGLTGLTSPPSAVEMARKAEKASLIKEVKERASAERKGK
jgi:hypothetical protein